MLNTATPESRAIPRKGIILLIAFFSLATGCNRAKPEYEIGTDESIQHDDFEYMVKDFHVEKQLGNGIRKSDPDQIFYIMTFSVVNHALRVNHQWDNSIAYVIDASGNIYENNVDLQKDLNEFENFGWQENYSTPFQSSQSTILIFELPVDVDSPCLMVRGRVLMGDVLNGSRFRKTKIRLY